MAAHWQEQFTASGRPMPSSKRPSTWEISCPYGAPAPVLPPFQFTDDSIIPVMVRIEDEEFDPKEQLHEQRPKRFSKLIFWLKYGTAPSHPSDRIVWMPRREYFKWFAHDIVGNYIGAEPPRSWTRKDLDAEFGKYQMHCRKWSICEKEGRFFMTESKDEA